MLKNLTISEVEAMATYRMLCGRLLGPGHTLLNEFDPMDLLMQSMYAINDILKEYGLNDELWARIRGDKVLLFFNPSHRVIAEVVVDSEQALSGMRKRPRVLLMSRYGYLRQKTVADLIMLADRLNRKYSERSNDGHYQSKAKRNWTGNHQAIRH